MRRSGFGEERASGHCSVSLVLSEAGWHAGNLGNAAHLSAAGESKRMVCATCNPGKMNTFRGSEYARVACTAALLPYA